MQVRPKSRPFRPNTLLLNQHKLQARAGARCSAFSRPGERPQPRDALGVFHARNGAPWAQEEPRGPDANVTWQQRAAVGVSAAFLAFCVALIPGGAPASAAESAAALGSTAMHHIHVSEPTSFFNPTATVADSPGADSPGARVRGPPFLDPLDLVYGVLLNHDEVLNTSNLQCSSKRNKIWPDFSVAPLSNVVAEVNNRAVGDAARAAAGRFSTSFTAYKGHVQNSRCDKATTELKRIDTGTQDTFCTAYELITGSECPTWFKPAGPPR